ncbi:MAG: B12-binding domain-containing radical SAM protein [Desulfosoma sp.]|uniref:B12-binding domain-containing radical SAM protein n=1 Tax=Desulfosoma sp. TaxID=2603217 RepID=UPI00404B8B3C
MNVVLLQLPVQSHDYAYPMENMTLGAGYLKAYAESVVSDVRIVLGPKDLVNYGGDAALEAWIVAQQPDLVGFSCYVWNVERSLALAQRLRARCPHVRILVGGPEVTPENDFLMAFGGFDVGIIGEGEQTFATLLSALSKGFSTLKSIPGLLVPSSTGWHVTQPRPPIHSLDAVPSPYLSGALFPSDAGTMLLETVRGCPNRCTYCYYHKRFPRVRHFSLNRLRQELLWAAHHGVSEIYFVDPCFTRRKDLAALLKAIEEARRLHDFTFQCEATAEDVSPALAQALARAGLSQVEVGLQTINPKALARIRRPFDRNRFVAGIRALRDVGIRVMVDIMVALPEDSFDDVKRSLDFVVDQALYDELSVYTLSLLPGTELRRQAASLGLLYDAKPPYHVIRTPHMRPDDIRRAYEYAQAASGVDFFPPEPPLFLDPPQVRHHGSLVVAFPVEKTLDLFSGHCAATEDSTRNGDASVGQALTVYVSQDTVHHLENPAVMSVLLKIFEKNPWSLLSLVITLRDRHFPWPAVFKAAQRVLAARDHVMDREVFSTLDPVRSVQILALLPVRGSQRLLARFPVIDAAKLEEPPALSPSTAHQAWVGLPMQASLHEEALWMEALWALFPPHIVHVRLGDGEIFS